MKALAFASAVWLLPAPAPIQDARIAWHDDPAAAFRLAEEEQRPLLFLLTGGACGGRAPIGDPSGTTPTGVRRGELETREAGGSADFRTRCELLEEDVLSRPDVAEAAARYVPVLLDAGAHPIAGGAPIETDTARRYQIATVPTLLLADPWGNEIVRLVGYSQRDAVLRILKALPADFAPLRPVGEALRADAEALPALLAAAAFYETRGLRPFAELYYERAAATPGAKVSDAARRQIAVSRGLNQLRMGQPKRAAEIFEHEARQGTQGDGGDALLFGWAMAALDAGDRRQAQRLSEQLGREFAASPYTAKLRQLLGAK